MFPRLGGRGLGFGSSHPSPCWDLVWLGLAWVPCVPLQLHWVPMCTCLAVTCRYSSLYSYTTSGSAAFLLLLPQGTPSLGRGGWGVYSHLRLGIFAVLVFVQWPVVGLSVHYHLLPIDFSHIWSLVQITRFYFFFWFFILFTSFIVVIHVVN